MPNFSSCFPFFNRRNKKAAPQGKLKSLVIEPTTMVEEKSEVEDRKLKPYTGKYFLYGAHEALSNTAAEVKSYDKFTKKTHTRIATALVNEMRATDKKVYEARKLKLTM